MNLINTNDFKDCIDFEKTSCTENGRTFKIDPASREERKKIKRIKVDDCIYNSNDSVVRCDYIFELKDVFSCFIELKGKDIKHAVEQLESSLKRISVTGKKHAFIVSSKNDLPNAKTDYQKWIRMFKKKYQTKFDMKNVLMSKSINDLR